jgi:hypothetical protein
MLIRPFSYPDILLLAPFAHIPLQRVCQHETAISDALAAAEAASSAVKAARTGTYRLAADRSVAVTCALAERLTVRARLRRLQQQRPSRRMTRSEVVRALIIAASYHPLPATGLGGKGTAITTVAIPAVVDTLLSRLQTDGRIVPLVDRALASPEIVALATAILLMPDAEQFAYDTLRAVMSE